ncbi:RNA-binding protein lsm5 [Xylographa carneopallida]|nr:RNA-binding protein lsm5 [Xylographa carneopallida]
MKGDKGKPASSTYLRCHHQAQHPEAYDNKLVEFAGTLLGFDDYVNMVLEDVTEFDYSGSQIKLSKILLNGNNICMLIPGGEGPLAAI